MVSTARGGQYIYILKVSGDVVRPERLWGPPTTSIQWVPGVLSLRVKPPGREADHSPPYSAGVKE